MPIARFQMPDGRIARFEVPEGTTPEQAQAMIAKAAAAIPAAEPPTVLSETGRLTRDLAGGFVRGAGSIGATLLAPNDMLQDALERLLGGKNASKTRNQQRREDMTGALESMGADPESMAFGGGKLASEIAGTVGVGPAIAGGLKATALASKAPALLDAIGSAGMTAKGAGIGTRAAGGAITGGAAAGLVDPDYAVTGAAIGGAFPPVLAGAGKLANLAAAPFKSAETKAAQKLLLALEDDPAAIVAKLRAPKSFVVGSEPTVNQLLRTPQSSALERLVSETPGGSLLKRTYDAQNTARLAAIDRVAPVDPRGFRSAQEDLGTMALKAIREGDKAAKAKTSAAYKAIPQDEAALYLPDLGAVRDGIYKRGAFGNRAAVDEAVRVANDIGSAELPKVAAVRGGQTQTLAQAVRKAGGISIKDNSGLRGEVAGLRGDLKNLVRTNGGKSPADMAETMQQAGFLRTDSTDELFDMLRREAIGGETSSMFDDSSRAWEAARRASMGDTPEAGRVAQKVTLGEFDALRKSIGNESRAASRNPERATEALTLQKMREAMDDRINEVVRGDGAIDENLPIAWANALTDAQGLKRAQVEKFRTGPQALAFKTGSDGLPSVQGGEFAQKIWGNRPGIANDIIAVRKVIDDHPEVLGKFKSLITTEGAGTATNAGNLTGKFVRWVDNSLPGLKATFKADEVKALQRIAADIRRAESAAAIGAAKGSPTYQNAAGAMSLGLLDSPLVNIAANRIPFVNQVSGPILSALKDKARATQASQLAGLLSDPALAADAINGLGLLRPVPLLEFQQGLLRAAPVAGSR